jgi:8-amino-7-oxononanoate synthase
LIQSRGRSFIFSTALPIPIVAAAHAAILVAREEKWRQRAVWERVQQFSQATGLHFTSPIAPIILGSADDTLKASRFSILHPLTFTILAMAPQQKILLSPEQRLFSHF